MRPLAESLKQFGEHVRGLETTREKAYTSLEEQIKGLSAAQGQLQKETANLVTALRKPQVRGRWGEMTLKRVAELAGMVEHCDFTEQVTVEAEGGRLRPDMVVRLPGEREIVVDAKVSLEAYLDAVAADTEELRAGHLARHAAQMRTHLNQLAAKGYWEQFDRAPEFVVMFIPGESFFAAAIESDRDLVEDGMKKSVVLATPTTLMALLRAVAFGWRQEQVTRNAQEISDLGRQVYERMSVLAGHLAKIGKGLDAADGRLQQRRRLAGVAGAAGGAALQGSGRGDRRGDPGARVAEERAAGAGGARRQRALAAAVRRARRYWNSASICAAYFSAITFRRIFIVCVNSSPTANSRSSSATRGMRS